MRGEVVPDIIGVYQDGDIISLNLKPAHDVLWIEAYPDMPKTFKQACMHALRVVHDQGVLHGDVRPHHFLISANNQVRIVDFSHARALHPPNTDFVKIEPATRDDQVREAYEFMVAINYYEEPVIGPQLPPPMRVVMPGCLKEMARNCQLSMLQLASPAHYDILRQTRRGYPGCARALLDMQKKGIWFGERLFLRKMYRDLRQLLQIAEELEDQPLIKRCKQHFDAWVTSQEYRVYWRDSARHIREDRSLPILTEQQVKDRRLEYDYMQFMLAGVLENEDDDDEVEQGEESSEETAGNGSRERREGNEGQALSREGEAAAGGTEREHDEECECDDCQSGELESCLLNADEETVIDFEALKRAEEEDARLTSEEIEQYWLEREMKQRNSRGRPIFSVPQDPLWLRHRPRLSTLSR